jgi:hypothetical protein
MDGHRSGYWVAPLTTDQIAARRAALDSRQRLIDETASAWKMDKRRKPPDDDPDDPDDPDEDQEDSRRGSLADARALRDAARSEYVRRLQIDWRRPAPHPCVLRAGARQRALQAECGAFPEGCHPRRAAGEAGHRLCGLLQLDFQRLAHAIEHGSVAGACRGRPIRFRQRGGPCRSEGAGAGDCARGREVEGRMTMLRGVQVELPPSAQSKYTALELARDSELDASRSAQARLNNMDDKPSDLRAKLEKARDEAARNHVQLHRLLSSTNELLFKLRLAPNQKLESVSIATTLRKGQSVAEAVAECRAEIAMVNQSIAAVRLLPLKVESRRDAVIAHLHRLALRVAPRLGYDRDGNARTLWAEEMVVNKDEVLGMICWCLGSEGPAQMAEVFEIAAGPEPENAVSQEEKELKMSELAATLLLLERKEAVLLNNSDGNIHPRAEMSPFAYLQVRIAEKAQEPEAAVA